MATRRSLVLFVVLAVAWGTAFVAIKAGLEVFPPVLFAAIRYDVAAAVMVGYAAWTSDYWLPRTRADWLTLVVEGVLLVGLYNAFLFVGQQGVTSGVAAILVGTVPLLSTVFSRLFLPGERLTPPGLAGVFVGLVGVALVARPARSLPGSGSVVPSAFILLSAVTVALGSVVVQRLDAGISSVGMVAWANVIGAALLHAISAGLPGESLSGAEFSTIGVAAVLYLAVVSSAVGYVVYFDLLARLGAVQINFVTYAVPVVATITGWLLLDERLGLLDALGFLVIFAGFLLLKRDAVRAELRPVEAWLRG